MSGGSSESDAYICNKDGNCIPVRIRASVVKIAGKKVIYGVFRDMTVQKEADTAFQILMEESALQIGEEYFKKIVNGIARWLRIDCVILGELEDHQIRTHAMVLDGKVVDNYFYPLAGSPCESVARKGYCEFKEGVAGKFPDDHELSKLGAEGYVGVPLKLKDGHAIGILCAISRNRLNLPRRTREVFEIISVRAAAEIERRHLEKTLRQERQVSHQIIETARDAFVRMNAVGIITDWNPRAEEMFGWSRDEALGKKPTEIIIPEESRKAHTLGLKRYLATGEGPILNRHIETTGLHRDGHTFPVELSIVPLHTNGDLNFSAFIRDISARLQAQKELEKNREQLRASLIGTIVAVSRAVEARDPYTAGHQQRVARIAREIAQEMGLDSRLIDGLRMGATIHDIGKIHLPAEILSKPTKLSEMELELIKTHAQIGYEILKDVPFPWPVADIAHQHHERLDGTGYPRGLKSDEICLEARIVAVADVVEAMASHRPYRPALGIDAALEEIETHRGQWYDPAAVDACLKLFREKKFSLK